jgi:L-gulonolactone oxidase
MTTTPTSTAGSATTRSTRWTNWARTVTAEPVAVEHPATVEQLQEAVATAARQGLRVKPVGSGHSFTPAAATDGVQLQLDRLTGVLRADRATGLVTALAGTRLRDLSETLWSLGLALPNLGDVDVQTISGAIATGTHGTGARFPGMAADVRGLELVLPDGSLLRADAGNEPDVLAAAAVGLGAFGVVASVTLQCVPAFAVAAAEVPEPLDEVLADLDGFAKGSDHAEFYWFPHTRRALTKRNTRLPRDAPPRPLRAGRRWLEDEFLANSVFGGINRVTTARPQLVPRLNAVAARALSTRRYTDRSYRVFASSRRVVFREMEYALPRDAVPEVLDGIEKWLAASGEQVAFPVEVRFADADDVWLSTAYGRPVAYVAVHQYWRRDHERYFAAVEGLCRAAGGRPHWGKLHSLGAAELAPLYPRFADAVVVRDRLDPGRTFANGYTDRVLGP